MDNQPKVSVVILNWNGQKHLEKFLPSVLASSYKNIEIWVADNGSVDNSILFLEQNFPQVRLLFFKENHGFAKGYNMALEKVEADYFVLLNSDVEVKANWLNPAIELLESDKQNAACQPKLLSYNKKNFFEYAGGAGGWLDRFGYPFAKGRIFDVCEEDHGQYNKTEQIFWTSGAAMIIRSSVFREMKGFDEYFFAHQEEIDLCWRIQLAGYKLFSCPASVVYHVGGGTLPRGNTLKTYLNFRNNLIMLFKNLLWFQKIWIIPFRIFLDALSAWKGLLKGDGGYFLAILRAHLSFVKWVCFKKSKSVFPEKREGILSGLYKGNVVWQHFAKKKQYFTEIIK